METINGKTYPLWSQFVDRKNEWIGGTLIDDGDFMDQRMLGEQYKPMETTITDIQLKPNGDSSAWFEVVGKDFSCGFDVCVGGISSEHTDDGICFSGYMGHTWKISK